MKLRKLIEECEKRLKESGDVDVFVHDNENGPESVSEIVVFDDDYCRGALIQ